MKKLVLLSAVCLLFVGCATKKFVSSEIERSEIRTQTQVEEVKEMIESTQTEVRDLAKEFDVKLDPVQKATVENAEVIAAMGELRFQKTLSDSQAFFDSDSDDLSDEAKVELDKFAEMIKAQNRIFNLEIQGHTDSLGSDSYNKHLGEARATAVLNYLYAQHDLPLHLMSTISMGPSQPIADNDTREGRAQNRRVVLVLRIKI